MKLRTTRIEQLMQMFNGAVWDGDLISKDERDALVSYAYVDRVCGWNIITAGGVQILYRLGLINTSATARRSQ